MKPGGTFAAGSYHTIGSSGNEAVDEILRKLETKSMNATLPPPETNFVSRWYRETAVSHYDNVRVPDELFTHETRRYWNLQAPIYYTQYSDLGRVDHRNPGGVGYLEVKTDLESYVTSPFPSNKEEHCSRLDSDRLNSTYTREGFLELFYTLDHYQKADSEEAVKQIWDILGPGAKLKINRPAQMIFARRI